MLKQYKTILEQAEAEIVEKKSRFIATVRPVKTEEDARNFIEEMKKKYWDATHHVFAYQLGERNEIQRFSDDGEPQGTAGLPVLNVLKGGRRQKYSNCSNTLFWRDVIGNRRLGSRIWKGGKRRIACGWNCRMDPILPI